MLRGDASSFLLRNFSLARILSHAWSYFQTPFQLQWEHSALRQPRSFPCHCSTLLGTQLICYCYCNPYNPLIKGVSRNSTEQRVSLYVVDPLLYLFNFSLSVSVDLIILNLFCTLSDCILCQRNNFLLNKTVHLTCKIAKHGFNCLRVQVTVKINDLYKANPAACLKHSQEKI